MFYWTYSLSNITMTNNQQINHIRMVSNKPDDNITTHSFKVNEVGFKSWCMNLCVVFAWLLFFARLMYVVQWEL